MTDTRHGIIKCSHPGAYVHHTTKPTKKKQKVFSVSEIYTKETLFCPCACVPVCIETSSENLSRMTTIFDGYDEEYRALSSDISKKISEVALYEDQKGAVFHS